jgi:acyl-CoA hydrolase
MSGETLHAASAYTIMVALDKNGNPIRVPRLLLETKDEKRRFAEAEMRRKRRLEREP